jgi:hypothetical protein
VHTKWIVFKNKMREYREDLERLENEGGKTMPTLRKQASCESDGFIFTYLGNNKIRVNQSGGTHNIVEIFETVDMDTMQDFESEISFWLYRANAI